MSKLQKWFIFRYLLHKEWSLVYWKIWSLILFFCAWCKTRLSQSNHDRCHFYHEKQDSFLLLWLRLFLTTLLGGTISTFLYSMSGALLSYFGMLLVKQLGPKRVSIIGISAAGGFMHNVGQLLMASFIAQSWTVMLYLPVLSVLGILSGIAIGIAANYLLRHVQTLQRFQKIMSRNQTKWSPMFTKNNRHTRSFYEATSNVENYPALSKELTETLKRMEETVRLKTNLSNKPSKKRSMPAESCCVLPISYCSHNLDQSKIETKPSLWQLLSKCSIRPHWSMMISLMKRICDVVSLISVVSLVMSFLSMQETIYLSAVLNYCLITPLPWKVSNWILAVWKSIEWRIRADGWSL